MDANKKKVVQICAVVMVLLLIVGLFLWNRPVYEEQWIWNGNDDYQYRIPGIICTENGTLITYCEQRKSLDDWSEINIISKISKDAGKTWSEDVVIVDGISEGKTVNNPVMIADGSMVHLLYEVEYALEEKGGGLYYCRSEDGGVPGVNLPRSSWIGRIITCLPPARGMGFLRAVVD